MIRLPASRRCRRQRLFSADDLISHADADISFRHCRHDFRLNTGIDRLITSQLGM